MHLAVSLWSASRAIASVWLLVIALVAVVRGRPEWVRPFVFSLGVAFAAVLGFVLLFAAVF